MAHDKSKIIPAVLEDMQNGFSLRYACEKHKMSAANFLLWVDADEALAKQYARAREVQAEFYADEIIRIADDTKDPQKARVQVDARKWIASKLLPKKFGDRIDMTSNGKELKAGAVTIERVLITKENGAAKGGETDGQA